jgi:uncharacterized protein YbjT (DUF2867 family)
VVLVVGGTGALGREVVARLLVQGERVRVMTRRPAAAAEQAAAGAEVVSGDLVDHASLARACQGARAVVAAAHAMLGRGRYASAHVDDRGHRALVDAAGAAGLGHLVYTSAYDCGSAYRAVPFFRIKRDIEQYIQAGRVPWTILRPTAFMDTHAHMLIGEPLLAGRPVRVIGPGDWPRNFIAAADVAQVAMRALREPSLRGRTIDIGSPEHHSTLDVVRLYEQTSGRTARVSHLPLGLAAVLARLLRPLHPGVSQILQISTVAAVHGERYDGPSFESQFGVTPIPLPAWITSRLAR